MEVQFHGANCFSFATKKARVVVDDNLSSVGLKSKSDKATALIYSHESLKPKTLPKEGFVIDGPGEYELSEVSVIGIPARAHMDEEGQHSATIYRIAAGGMMMVSLGHIHPDITDDQLEHIGMVDIAFIPVGDSGYTLDAQGAAKVLKKVEPKIIIPTHYAEKGVNYEVPMKELAEFVKEIGAEPEKVAELKFKSGIVPDTLTLYQLDRT